MFPVLENFDEIVDIDVAYTAGDLINGKVGRDKQFFGFRDAKEKQVFFECNAGNIFEGQRQSMAADESSSGRFLNREFPVKMFADIVLGVQHG